MYTAENIFLLSVHMLLGVSLLLFLFAVRIWTVTKDKTIAVYCIYLVGCLMMALVKMITIDAAPAGTDIMENSWVDELMGAVWGTVYIFFFGWAFQFYGGGKFKSFFWKLTLGVMVFQILYLLYARVIADVEYFSSVIFVLIFLCVTVFSVVLLFLAIFQKNKTRFQKYILAGGILFYVLVLIGNLQQVLYKEGNYKGFSSLFFSIILENIFFAFAIAQKVSEIFLESEKIKISSYLHQLEFEKITNFFTTSISSKNTVDELLWDVTKNCISKLGFEDCVIYLKDEQRNVLVQKAAWGPKTSKEYQIISHLEVPLGKGIIGTVAQTGIAEMINDTSADVRYIQDDALRYSDLAVPIISNGKVIGVIDSEHPQKNFYTQQHLQLLSTIAALCADKMETIYAETQTKAKEMEVLKLQKDLADWQLTSLKAQMNPHFLFNAMNSIQQFTLQNDSDNANLYISKFSTLLRKVLHTSQEKYISLEEEVEQLKLYLDIEQLRLGKDFSYEITVDEEIETDALKIPGMLIQPFAENSLKHGLAAKEGDKKLSIHFKLLSETQVFVTVADNGIGRKKAQELKEQQQKFLPHQSRGIELIKERLHLLHAPAGEELIVFYDLKDAEGRATGTLIEVKLPVLFS